MKKNKQTADELSGLGLYLHIPFCLSKCAYCDFYSLPCGQLDARTQKADMRRYTDSLMLHMEDYSRPCGDYIVETVFIGGGTPTCMPAPLLLDIIDSAYDNFQIAEEAEFTIEANPATVDRRMLKALRKNGVNRISFGLQSANDDELRGLSRAHNYEDFLESFDDARRAGFDNINVDIMYGIPNQTKESLRATLDRVISLNPEHISFYGLKIEEGTPFARRRDTLILPDEDTECDMYLESIEYLEKAGYRHYEISNFARDGFECKHNLKYWNCEDYLGLGPAAHSYFGGKRFSFKRDIKAYMDALEDPDNAVDPLDDSYEVSQNDRSGEYIMLRLRLCDGIDTKEYEKRFGMDFERQYGKYLKLYVENDFMRHDGDSYSFTSKGMYVSNYILSAMLDFDSGIDEKKRIGTEM